MVAKFGDDNIPWVQSAFEAVEISIDYWNLIQPMLWNSFSTIEEVTISKEMCIELNTQPDA